MSKILCPYCRQEIEDTDKVCPFCKTKLQNNDYKTLLIPMGFGLYILWFIANIIGFVILNHWPQIMTTKDKDGDLIFSLVEYTQICLQPLVVVFVPYIIALVKKYKVKEATAGISICIIFAVIFVIYFIHLQKVAGV